tara:strand:+ start:358 stop:702 length:345 start_codon:yes stop_codon:yes gene_type:complete
MFSVGSAMRVQNEKEKLVQTIDKTTQTEKDYPMTNLWFDDNEIEELGGYTQGKGEAYKKTMQTIDLQCHGFTIEVHHDDNTLLCNGGFVFSDPDITKLYIVLGKHLASIWQNNC